METIASRLHYIRQQITATEQRCRRTPGSVKLVAVSKGHTIDAIQAAVSAQQYCFGENYIQEALPKIEALRHLNLEWHFIGVIQSNKTKDIAANFNWVHSVCRLKIAERLNEQRSIHLPPLNICIEVNVSHDPHKSGIATTQLLTMAQAIAQLPQLKLRGLMTIPVISHDPKAQQLDFHNLYQAYITLQQQGFELDTLSMGMSDDFEIAICEGSTLVRIGTAIFGRRI